MKTRVFSQFVPDSHGSQKLLTAQLVPDLPASQKLQSAQLVPELPSSPKLFEAQLDQSAPSSSSQQPQKVKRERPGRTPGILGGIRPQAKMLALRWKMLEVTGKGHQEVGLLRPTAAEPQRVRSLLQALFWQRSNTRRRLFFHRRVKDRLNERFTGSGGSVGAGRQLPRATRNIWRVSLGMPDNTGFLPVFSGVPAFRMQRISVSTNDVLHKRVRNNIVEVQQAQQQKRSKESDV